MAVGGESKVSLDSNRKSVTAQDRPRVQQNCFNIINFTHGTHPNAHSHSYPTSTGKDCAPSSQTTNERSPDRSGDSRSWSLRGTGSQSGSVSVDHTQRTEIKPGGPKRLVCNEGSVAINGV